MVAKRLVSSEVLTGFADDTEGPLMMSDGSASRVSMDELKARSDLNSKLSTQYVDLMDGPLADCAEEPDYGVSSNVHSDHVNASVKFESVSDVWGGLQPRHLVRPVCRDDGSSSRNWLDY